MLENFYNINLKSLTSPNMVAHISGFDLLTMTDTLPQLLLAKKILVGLSHKMEAS